MLRLFANPRVTILVVALAVMALLALIGGAIGAAFGFGFLGGPIAHIQIPAERVFTVLGFDVMNTMLMLWAAIIVLLAISYIGTRKISIVPGKLQSVLEMVVEFFASTAEAVAGGRQGRVFVPLVLTIFLGVLFANWLGVVPGVGTIGPVETAGEIISHAHDPAEVAEERLVVFDGERGFLHVPFGRGQAQTVALRDVDPVTSRVINAPPDHPEFEGRIAGRLVPLLRGSTTDLNTTLGIAIIAMVAVQIWGIRALGLRGYGGKFFTVTKGPIMFAVGLLEAFGEFARIVSFTFRLFGNMFAGEVLLVAMMFLFPLIGIIPFIGMELFIGLIQAFIFAMLTLVFGALAIAGHGDEEHSAQGQEGR